MEKVSETPEKEVAILYSGGLDSTHTAIHYLERGVSPHLITFDNGAVSFLEQIERQLSYLERVDPNIPIIFKIISIRHLMRKIVFDTLTEDILEFKQDMTCVGCKIAMTAEIILYAIRHGIKTISDGYRKKQDYHPEQTTEFMDGVDSFVRDNGLNYTHPVYDVENNGELIDRGIRHNIPFTSVQTYCVIFSPDTQRGQEAAIADYVAKKIPVAQKYIDDELSAKR